MRAPELLVCISSEVLPEIREYERTSTTVVNAYVLPIVEHYLSQLRARLDAIDVTSDKSCSKARSTSAW